VEYHSYQRSVKRYSTLNIKVNSKPTRNDSTSVGILTYSMVQDIL